MSHAPALPEIYLARHGETEWSMSGQHTGLTDIPLTERGERNAQALVDRLRGITFDRVWTSPLIRAKRTAELAGFPDAEPTADLVEWNYGRYEGLKTKAIREQDPDWDLFRDGAPDGESVAEVGTRADRVVARLRAAEGRTLLFSHGHFCRVLAARWLGQPVDLGRLLILGTAALNVLGYDHNPSEPAIRLWNDHRHVGE